MTINAVNKTMVAGAGGVLEHVPVANNALYVESFNFTSACKTAGYGGAVDCSTLDTGLIEFQNVAEPQSGNVTEVTAAANNPNGDGGMGLRIWISDGENNNSKDPAIVLTQSEPEFWVRWYMRFEAGFAWTGGNPNYHKILDMWETHPAGGNRWIFDSDTLEYVLWRAGMNIAATPAGNSWQDVFGTTSDGLFHMFEYHFKADTVAGNDGIFQAWIDGNLVINRNNLNLTDGNPNEGPRHIDISLNQRWAANGAGSPMYVDFDDFAFYTETPPNTDASSNPWIGPLNGFSGGA